MTSDDDKPISLVAERAKRERDFTAERADLLQELKDIGVEEAELAATVQHVMLIEWCFFHAIRMCEYHDVAQDPQAIVRLVQLMRPPRS
jgi:hypothetical protein